MKLRYYFLLLIGLFIAETRAFAQIDIPICAEDDIPAGTKSLQFKPSAFVENAELNIRFALATESQVVIVDQSNQIIVVSETFASARSVVIDLEDEGLEEGTYMLRIYAFGKWWWGEFEIGGN